jgi:hypothetical protein
MTLNSTGGSATFTTSNSLILAGQNSYNLNGSTITANLGYYIDRIERYVPYNVNPTTTITLGSNYTSYTFSSFSMSSAGVNANDFETIKVYFATMPVGVAFVDVLYTNDGTNSYDFRLYQSTAGVTANGSYVSISAVSSSSHIPTTETSSTTSYLMAGYSASINGDTRFYRFGINTKLLRTDYPSTTTFTFNMYGTRTTYNQTGTFTVRNSIKRQNVIDVAGNNGVNFSTAFAENKYFDSGSCKICNIPNTYLQVGYFTYKTADDTIHYTDITDHGCTPVIPPSPSPTPSITPTSSPALATVFLNPLNSLDTNSYVIYINGVADGTFKSGYKNYPQGTSIAIYYNSPACNVTLGGSGYTSSTIVTLSGNTSYNFQFSNANNYTLTGGGFCSACVSYVNSINDCGQQISTPGGSYCNTAANYVTNVGTMYVCYGGGFNSYSVYQNDNACFGGNQYYSNGNSYAVNPSNSVNSAANWVSNGAAYCTGCNQYQPQIDNNTCSSTYNTTRNALIGSNTTACGGCCGQSTAANWTDQGYSTCSSCVSYTVFKDTNSCSSTYNHYRVNGVDVGTSQPSGAACNTAANWTNTGTQCVGYTKYDVQTDNNPCSSTYNTTRLQNAVPNSPSCGYVAATTFNIIAYDAYGYVSGTYTDKFGNAGTTFYFSDYSGFDGNNVGSICAINGTVSITGGAGGAVNTGTAC